NGVNKVMTTKTALPRRKFACNIFSLLQLDLEAGNRLYYRNTHIRNSLSMFVGLEAAPTLSVLPQGGTRYPSTRLLQFPRRRFDIRIPPARPLDAGLRRFRLAVIDRQADRRRV